MLLTIISIAMAVLWAETFTTGDDDLFWAWVIVSPIYLILFSHNFVFFDGKKQKSASFFLSFFLSCSVWLIFFLVYGHPWNWNRSTFDEVIWASLLPPVILLVTNVPYSKSPENRFMHRIGIIASIPYCTAGVVGLMYLIPTGVVLLLAYGVAYFIAKGGDSPGPSGSQEVKEGTQLITDEIDDLTSDEME